MNRRIIAAILILTLGLTAYGQKETAVAAQQNTEEAGLANPWREITESEANEICPRSFRVPEDAQDVRWSVMDAAADPSGVPGPLVQLAFVLDGNSFTAREQLTGSQEIDQSGMYYEWTVCEEGVLHNWYETACRNYRCIDDSGYADLCTWYDAGAGISYSVSVTAEDLDGFDLQAVAEALSPFDGKDYLTPSPEELADGFFKVIAAVEQGSAGASLKCARAAAEAAVFAADHRLWDPDGETLRTNMQESWENLAEKDRSSFRENFGRIADEISGCLENWDSVKDTYEDAGADQQMEMIVFDPLNRLAWQNLCVCVQELGFAEAPDPE